MIAQDSRPVLIVDDDQTTRDVLDELLKGAGFVTLRAHNCAEAEAFIQRYPIGLILLDVYLPDGNGIEFCARLQSLPTMSEVPVLLISADHDISAKVNGFQAGAADYITKPIAKPELLARVHTHLRLRKNVEALRTSEQEHRRLFDTMAQGVIYQAADGDIISANPAAERILGLTADQMRGKDSMDPRWIMIEEDGAPVLGPKHPAMQALKTGKQIGPVIRGVFHPDKNAYVWLSITAIPLFQPGATVPFQVYAVFEDVTERILEEKQVLFDYRFRARIAKLSAHFVEARDEASFDIAVNKALASLGLLFGMDRSYLFRFTDDLSVMENTHEWCAPGITAMKDHLQQIPSDTVPWWMARLRERRPLQIPLVGELPADAAKEKEMLQSQDIQSVIILPFNNECGELIGFMGFDAVRAPYTWSDVHLATLELLAEIIGSAMSRMAATRALAESEQKYRALYDQSTEGIYLHDVEGHILDVNDMACAQSGYSREELLDFTVFDFQPSESKTNMPRTEILRIWSQWKPGQRFVFEGAHQRKDGSIYPVEISTGVVRYGNANMVLATVKDITDRKRAQKRLQDQDALLQVLTRLATDFINNPLGQLDDAIDDMLSTLGNFTKVDRVYIFEHDHARETTSCTKEWCALGITPQRDTLQDFPFDAAPAFMEALRQGKPYIVPDVADVHPDDPMKSEYERQGIRSLVALPLMQGETCMGFMGFDSVSEVRKFEEHEIQLLEVAAEIIINSMARKDAETSLRKSETQLANAARMAHMGHWELDIEKWTFTLSESFYALYGTTAQEMGGYTMSLNDYAQRFVHPEDAAVVAEETRKALATEALEFSDSLEHRMLYADGSPGYVAVRYSIVKNARGKTIKTYGVNQDITERKEAEIRLQELSHQLRELARHLQEVQESESRRIAVWLHDEIGQMLTRARLDAMLVNRLTKDLPPKAASSLLNCQNTIDDAITAIQKLCIDLRPAMLDDFGLASALEYSIEEDRERMDIPIHFEAHHVPDTLSPELSLAFYRVARECLTNISRHANASHVWVRLSLEDNVLELVVRDDGRGFTPPPRPDSSAFGLNQMHERAQAVGGALVIISEPGHGTEVQFTAPIGAPKQKEEEL